MQLELIGFEGCPHLELAAQRLEEVRGRLAPDASVETLFFDAERAEREGFPGSPTIRVNGRDLEGPRELAPGLSCRRYGTDGAPPAWLLEAAILGATRPREVLFLCVANSARSQLAEGVARSLVPSWMHVRSAGSQPTSLRPEALDVLAEIGIDALAQRSKRFDEVPLELVEVVITLCAEEVCPVLPVPALRAHWELPDPAAVDGAPSLRRQAFRDTLDELLLRLRVLAFHAAD